MEPERKHKKRSKSMTGGRDIDVFERRCAELEKQIDRLQQENMVSWHTNCIIIRVAKTIEWRS